MNDKNEKSLTYTNNSFFDKIKSFIKSLFHKKQIINKNNDILVNDEERRIAFMESIRNIENEETKILKLQQLYRTGAIKEEDLTDEEIRDLCNLYDKQIADLRRSNEKRKNRILEYRKKVQENFY